MIRTVIHGARMGGEVSKWGLAYRYQISISLWRGVGPKWTVAAGFTATL